MEYFAHSQNSVGTMHTTRDHLAAVSKLAGEFAGDSFWKIEAVLAGMLHDLGKYADLFQARLRGEASGLDHWSPGAWVALKDFKAIATALAVQGHHVGLQQGNRDALRAMNPMTLAQHHPFNLKLSDPDLEVLRARAGSDGIIFPKPDGFIIDHEKGFQNPVAAMLDVRMLFSCLTDADFMDTESHFKGDTQGKRFRELGPQLDLSLALAALDTYMSDKVRGVSKADRAVLDARNSLWERATDAAGRKPELFTLTAPTGSGKTLAMLKFALEHAAKNGLKRVILAVPFLSIIEQTANIFRTVFQEFPNNFVLEDHSLAGLGSEESKDDVEVERARRLLAENWEAPIIITTNVQLLESLFSNRPAACRKLHNLMNSVVMFDEAQTLPQSLAVPTLAALSHLSHRYGTTVLFATATQPAFDALDNAVTKLINDGWRPIEVVPEHTRIYDALRRYDVRWPRQGETKEWAMLAEEIRNNEQVLCVVNLKNHASKLLDDLKNDTAVFHLSTNLCALHRRAVLTEVRARLETGKPCRLISTQCVEAGVDVDFPVVCRALAPLDAIAQAAGRCNREGRLTNADGKKIMGDVHVFEPAVEGDYHKRYPNRAYFQATEVTRSMLIAAGTKGLDLNDPTTFRDYYHRLYDLNKPETQNHEIIEAVKAVDFVRVAKEYRLIEQSAIRVLVSYGKHIDLFKELRNQQDEEGISVQWIRRAQGLSVSIFRPRPDHPSWDVLLPAKLRYGKGTSDEWFILEDPRNEYYDKTLGLRLPQSQQIFIA